jgi:cation:H+ antiporter
MIAVAVACLPIFLAGYRIARWEGGLFLSYYLAYTLFIMLTAMQHHGLSMLTQAMTGFVIPLTLVTLAISLWRSYRQKS